MADTSFLVAGSTTVLPASQEPAADCLPEARSAASSQCESRRPRLLVSPRPIGPPSYRTLTTFNGRGLSPPFCIFICSSSRKMDGPLFRSLTRCESSSRLRIWVRLRDRDAPSAFWSSRGAAIMYPRKARCLCRFSVDLSRACRRLRAGSGSSHGAPVNPRNQRATADFDRILQARSPRCPHVELACGREAHVAGAHLDLAPRRNAEAANKLLPSSTRLSISAPSARAHELHKNHLDLVRPGEPRFMAADWSPAVAHSSARRKQAVKPT